MKQRKGNKSINKIHWEDQIIEDINKRKIYRWRSETGRNREQQLKKQQNTKTCSRMK